LMDFCAKPLKSKNVRLCGLTSFPKKSEK